MLLYIRTFLLLALLPFSLHANPVVQDQIHKSAVVFVYHRFGESKYPSTNIKLAQFQEQLDYLESHNYNVVKLSTIIEHIKAKKTLPPKSVALTMDDAYYSVYTNAYPMLKAKGYPFSVFVNTNPIDNRSKNYVTWDQMREMQENGAEFFNHSLRHDYLLTMQKETQEQAKERITKDILQAQKRLDAELGTKTLKVLAYPFGEYDLQTKEILKSLEFIGVAQNSGPMGLRSDLQALTRFPMAELFAKMAGFKTKLN
ncbi:MAG: polysaccharide deacetylase family protein, partial [Sulfurimonas sp.]|nr:polysaccharide deacetylase family protein [Sulfurimonas sp.]